MVFYSSSHTRWQSRELTSIRAGNMSLLRLKFGEVNTALRCMSYNDAIFFITTMSHSLRLIGSNCNPAISQLLFSYTHDTL